MAETIKNCTTGPINFSEGDTMQEPLLKQIEDASDGLIYISETDAPVLPFDGGKTAFISKEVVLSVTGNTSDAAIEEKDFSEFFDRLTVIRDWFSEERTSAANKFLVLRELMERNLQHLSVFRIGLVNIKIYVVGIDADNNLAGIKTSAVET